MEKPVPPVENVENGVVNGSDPCQDGEVDSCPPQTGYRHSIWRSVLFYGLAVVPAGLGLLLAYWFPAVWLRLTAYRCPLGSASRVIVKDLNGNKCVEVVKTVTLPGHTHQPIRIGHTFVGLKEVWSGGVVRYMVHRHLRYLYQPSVGKFVLLRGLDGGHTSSALHGMRGGLSLEQHSQRVCLYGENSIDVPVKPYHVLLVEEVLHPFYIFQLVSVVFWIVEQYYYYAGAVFLISCVSVIISLLQTRRHLQQIHDIAFSSTTVTVVREGREMSGVPSSSIVPGDVLVVLPSGLLLPCDAALLTGQAIVNEAMLTGECVPVTKTPLPPSSLHYLPSSSSHKRHTLFCGTQVVQTRFYGNERVLAAVVGTGFSTAKGGMVRSILFPRKLSVRFYADAMKFVLLLSILAGCGFIYTLAINFYFKFQVKDTIMRAFDVITIAVPPALPAALTVGIVYALARLRRNNIFCISPQRVTLAGKVKLVCFDKTGTLTEDSLDLLGVQPVVAGSFTSGLCSARDLPQCPLLYAMATTHSLATINGELTGDPIDLKMFQGTGWVLREPPPGSFDTLTPTIACPPGGGGGGGRILGSEVELAQLRMFTFSSDLQRMSVIVRVAPTSDPKQLHVFCKGAPETICRLCHPDSVPGDFPEVLGSLTQQGYRVLAVAHRPLHMAWHKAERVKREVVECGLRLAGLIVMQNRLKSQTTPVMSSLRRAGLRNVMITGDHLLTGVCVARECGMIPSTHSVIVAETTPTSLVSFRVLGEGRSPTTESVRSGEEGTTPLISKAGDLRPPFHMALDGKTFSVLRESSSQDDYQRVLVKGTVFAVGCCSA
jgi:predicted P-type ATPase